MTISERQKLYETENPSMVFLDRTEWTTEGVEWNHMKVIDQYTDASVEATDLRNQIANWNADLREGRAEQVAPEIEKVEDGPNTLQSHNVVSEAVYDNEAMRVWRADLVPSALALVPLQDPTDEVLPDESSHIIDEQSRMFFVHSLDAIAIRSRAAIMQEVASRTIGSGESSDQPVRMISVASGTAKPVIGAVERLDSKTPVQLTLVDIDPRAQSMAAGFIEEAGVENLTFEPRYNNIIKDLVATDRLVDEIGEEQADFVDAMGIFEYIMTKNGRAADFLHNTYKMVRPGGTLVVGNMLDTHPELDFNKYGIGWPLIHPRSREELLALVVDAGINLGNVIGHQAEDGVYAVIEIRKPSGN